MNRIKRIVEEMIPGYVWLAQPHSKVELAEMEARRERLHADWVAHTREHPPLNLNNIAVNVIHIPIFPEDEIVPKQGTQ
jgi:hypothetical protein